MFRTGGWNGVPAGSQVTVTLDPGPTGVSGSYTVAKAAGAPVLQAALGSGNFPLRFTVGAGEHHKVNLDASSTGPDTIVTFTADIATPTGASDTFQVRETVTDSDPLTIKLFVNG